jgi:Transmembrane domain of unknown function (DUF3566)
VDNRVESSRAAGEGSPGITADPDPAENPDGPDELAAEETAAEPADASKVSETGEISGSTGQPAYPSQNGYQHDSDPPAPGIAAPPVPSGTQSMPSLMAPAPSSGETTSIQGAAMAAVATAASGARGVASKITATFSSVTRPRTKPSRLVASRPMARPSGTAAGGLPPRPQAERPQPGGAWAGQVGPAPRSALLSLQRVEPLSVMKFSAMLSLVAWVVIFVAVAIVWYVLNKLGVFTSIEKTVGLVTYSKSHPGTNAASWFRASRVLGYTALVCTVNAFLFTALATIGAALYNLITHLTGGIEVTLKETD